MSTTPTFDTLFEAGDTYGPAPRGVRIGTVTQDAEVRITGVHDLPGGTLAVYRIVAGTSIDFFAMVKNSGRITKIEARAVVAGALVSWTPILA